MKTLLLTILLLAGCASQPQGSQVPYNTDDMKYFAASCRSAREQIEYLTRLTNEYQVYHAKNPTYTHDDRIYYGRLRNNIWLIRSTCTIK